MQRDHRELRLHYPKGAEATLAYLERPGNEEAEALPCEGDEEGDGQVVPVNHECGRHDACGRCRGADDAR